MSEEIYLNKEELRIQIRKYRQMEEELRGVFRSTNRTYDLVHGVTEVSTYSTINQLDRLNNDFRETLRLIEELASDMERAIKTMEQAEEAAIRDIIKPEQSAIQVTSSAIKGNNLSKVSISALSVGGVGRATSTSINKVGISKGNSISSFKDVTINSKLIVDLVNAKDSTDIYSFKNSMIAQSVGSNISLSNKNVQSIKAMDAYEKASVIESVGQAVKQDIDKIKAFFIDKIWNVIKEFFEKINKDIQEFEANAIKIKDKIENKVEGYVEAVGKGVKAEVSKLVSAITLTNDEKLQLKQLAGKAVNQSINFITSGEILTWGKEYLFEPQKAFTEMDKQIDDYVNKAFKILGIDKNNPIYWAYENFKYIKVREQVLESFVINTVRGLGQLVVTLANCKADISKAIRDTLGLLIGVVTQEEWSESMKNAGKALLTYVELPVGMVVGIVKDVITLFTPSKAKEFFTNQDAMPEDVYDYGSAVANILLLLLPIKAKFGEIKVSAVEIKAGFMESLETGSLSTAVKEAGRLMVGQCKVAAAEKVAGILRDIEGISEYVGELKNIRVVWMETPEGVKFPQVVKISPEEVEAVEKSVGGGKGDKGAGNLKNITVEEVTPPGAKNPVQVYTDGYAQVNKGKIEIYIRGKIKKPSNYEELKDRIAELKKIQNKNPSEFTKEMDKELGIIRDLVHNYDRCQGMGKLLDDAGIIDTTENNEMIAKTVLDSAKEVTPKNTKIRSFINAGNKPVIVESWWIIDKDGTPYCSTIILIEVK